MTLKQHSSMSHNIEFIGPMDLTGYNRSLAQSSQPSNIPRPFLDAMVVREEVFVKEQGVPLEMEADEDDSRSCHWVAYDTENKKPAGTVRLVPFPHDPHPLPGSNWDIPEETEIAELAPKDREFIQDRKTTLHDGREPYIKFGRWAVTRDFRGRGIAVDLVKTAIKWAQGNPRFFDQDLDGVPAELTHWNGLICVHAQEYVSGAWKRLGFEVDEGMGKWTEAGIPHVGMFLRLVVD